VREWEGWEDRNGKIKEGRGISTKGAVGGEVECKTARVAGGKLGFALVGLGGLGVEAAGWALCWAWPARRLLPFLFKKNCFLLFILLFLFKPF
jgi:hypothetical protein